MESATYDFNCPHCGRQISGSPSHAGTTIDCPNCGKSFTVPALSRPPGGGGNPLLVPLVAVSVLFVAALGIGGYLWMGRGQGAPAPVNDFKSLTSGAAAAPVKSAEPNSFAEVAAHLDAGGSFYVYLDTAPFLAGLSQQINSIRDLLLSVPASAQDAANRNSITTGFAVINDLVKKSGLEGVSGVGASTIAVEPGIYLNKVFVHQGSGEGNGFLWTAFGKAPHHLEAIDFLPEDTVLASSTDLDLSNFLAGVGDEVALSGMPNGKQLFDASLAQLASTTGMSLDDILKSLDGSVAVVLTLNPAKTVSVPSGNKEMSIPMPRLAFLLRVKNDRIFSQVDRAAGANPGILRKDDADLKLRTLPLPGPMQEWLQPTVAQWAQGYLVIASDESIVRDIAAAQKTGKGLKSTTQFASLMSGLPQEGNAFQIVTPQFGQTWARLQREVLSNQPGATPEQMAMMQKLFGNQSPGSVFSVSTHLPDGWLIVGKGTQGASQMLGPLLIAPAAILAGAALPVFSKVDEKGKATKSLSQAKQLATGCKLYAIDNQGKFPPTLQALVPDYIPNTSIFPSPFMPGVPLGYDYTPGLTDTSPAGTVLIEDKFAPQVAHVRVVAHVDTSAQVIPIPHNPGH